MAQKVTQLELGIVRVCRVLFGFVAVYAAWIIASDAWGLIPADVVLQRWLLAAIMLVPTTLVWYLVRQGSRSISFYKSMVGLLILVYIGVAAYSVYATRGMASRAALLFLIPIMISAVLSSRIALFTTAIWCMTAYILSCVWYFTQNLGEGYKVELYAEVGFYAGLFLIFAALIWAIVRKNAKDA